MIENDWGFVLATLRSVRGWGNRGEGAPLSLLPLACPLQKGRETDGEGIGEKTHAVHRQIAGDLGGDIIMAQ
jgi:hypothetical protein